MKTTAATAPLDTVPADFTSFEASFPLKGSAIYELLFARHGDSIKTKKAAVAAANLEKIFQATFTISSRIGFHEMSLRQLSTETGISMGGIYSCIGSKDDLAIMVKDVVHVVTDELVETALSNPDVTSALDDLVRRTLYASHILQPWFFFLYFETRCLPAGHQADSKDIELRHIQTYQTLIERGIESGYYQPVDANFLAATTLVMQQDWYCKPWKHEHGPAAVETYAAKILTLIHQLLR
ncbi:MAG: TetR/AcrR family transcriptional regulator [Gammaproteobacteria bacterium]|nr:TetR/AcrR family transcriptional regulator [Gammaproteobacteria bacterium]